MNSESGSHEEKVIKDLLKAVHKENPKHWTTLVKDWKGVAAALGEPKSPRVVILNHPRDLHAGFRPFDTEAVGDDDPINDAIKDGTLDAKDCRKQPRFDWGATPMFWRSKDGEKWTALTPQPGIVAAGIELHDGINGAVSEIFDNYGADPSNFDGAVYVCVVKGKKGKGKGERPEYTKTKFDARSAASTASLRASASNSAGSTEIGAVTVLCVTSSPSSSRVL